MSNTENKSIDIFDSIIPDIPDIPDIPIGTFSESPVPQTKIEEIGESMEIGESKIGNSNIESNIESTAITEGVTQNKPPNDVEKKLKVLKNPKKESNHPVPSSAIEIEKGQRLSKNESPKKMDEIIALNEQLRNFLLYSNRHWKKRYPGFRADYQGDKSIGYALAKGIVSTPKQYKKLRSISLLSEKVLTSLPIKSGKSFVIKESLGHAGNRVLCMHYDPIKKVYNDYLHHSKDIEESKVINYIKKKLVSNQSRSGIIIEELLPFTSDIQTSEAIPAPPPDYKVYVVMGKPRQINIYFRLRQGKFECSYVPTKDGWKRIPLNELYYDLVKLGYNDLPDTIPFDLPPVEVQKKLLETATKLAKAHDAKFVRYDFYVIKDRIILGEITPLCGGVRNNLLKERMLDNLFPVELRKTPGKRSLSENKISTLGGKMPRRRILTRVNPDSKLGS